MKGRRRSCYFNVRLETEELSKRRVGSICVEQEPSSRVKCMPPEWPDFLGRDLLIRARIGHVLIMASQRQTSARGALGHDRSYTVRHGTAPPARSRNPSSASCLRRRRIHDR